MTREEAARILDPETSMETLAEIEYYAGFSGREAVKKAMHDARVMGAEALSQPPADQWIPCSEHLPPNNGLYWVTIDWDGREVYLCSYYNREFSAWGGILRLEALAWKPATLPEPYKGDANV